MKKFLIVVLLLISPSAWAANIVGYLEDVGIEDSGVTLNAKLDTGADTSSINAKIISQHSDEIKFVVGGHVFDKKIVRWAKIKLHPRGYNLRPVVLMRFYLGRQIMYGEVNLNDRESFDYPVLPGRNMLKTGNFIVDPASIFTLNENE